MPTWDVPLQGHSAESESITMGASTSRERLRDGPEASPGGGFERCGRRRKLPGREPDHSSAAIHTYRAATASLKHRIALLRGHRQELAAGDIERHRHGQRQQLLRHKVPCSHVQRRTVRFAERQVGPAPVGCCWITEREGGSVEHAHSERIATAAI